jgi:putative DNA primase/helicase
MNVEIRPNRISDYCTKISGCAVAEPGTPCPMWLSFLDTVMGNNQSLIDYLQRVCGYCLTGLIKEQVLFFLYGTGANGKGVFIKDLSGLERLSRPGRCRLADRQA